MNHSLSSNETSTYDGKLFVGSSIIKWVLLIMMYAAVLIVGRLVYSCLGTSWDPDTRSDESMSSHNTASSSSTQDLATVTSDEHAPQTRIVTSNLSVEEEDAVLFV